MISRCTGVTLAGGRSTRFAGARKGLLELGGRRIVDWTIEALRGASDELLLITNDPVIASAIVDVPTRTDARAERGSLVGLYSALTYCADAALVVAWDMPFVSTELLAALRRRGEEVNAAVVPDGPAGPEPLCAYYPRACRAIIEQHLASSEMRLSHFVAALPRRAPFPVEEVRTFGAPERLFANVNSADDLAAARFLAMPSASSDAASRFPLSPSNSQ